MKRRFKKWGSLFLTLSVIVSLAVPASAENISPEWNRVFKSLEVTQNNMKKDHEEGRSEVSKLIKSILEKPYSFETNAELLGVWENSKEVSNKYGLKGLGMQVSGKYDREAMTQFIEGNLNKNKNVLVSGEAFLSPRLVAVGSKELLGSSYYGIDLTTWEKDFKQGFFGEAIKAGVIDEQEFRNNIKSIQNYIAGPGYPSVKLVNEQITKAFLKCLTPSKEDLAKNNIQKTNTTTIVIKKTSVTCDEYTIKLSKDWVHHYIDQTAGKLKHNAEFQAILKKELALTYSTETSDEFYDEFNKEMVSGINETSEGLKSLLSQDINVKLYINQEDELVRVNFETTICNTDEPEDKVNLNLDMAIGDGKSLTDGFAAVLKVIVPTTKQEAALKFEMNREKTESTEIDECILSADAENQNSLTFKAKFDYDLKKTKDNVNLELMMKADGAAWNVKGTGDLLVDSQSPAVNLQVSDLSITLGYLYDKMAIKLKGGTSLKQINANEVNLNGKDVKMVFKMSQSELDALDKQVQLNYQKLEEKLEKLFNSTPTYEKK